MVFHIRANRDYLLIPRLCLYDFQTHCSCCSHTCALSTDPDLIHRSLCTGHIPVIPCVGETRGGQLMPLHMDDVLALLLPQVTPRKVLMVNFDGALLDDRGEVLFHAVEFYVIKKNMFKHHRAVKTMYFIRDL